MQLQPMGLRRPGVYQLWHVGHQGGPIWRARSPLAHCARPYSGLERRELGVTVILFRNCHVLPWLRISIREALEVRGIYRFETPSPIGMIAMVRFEREPLGKNDCSVPVERKDVWAGHPDGIEERVEVEIVGQHGLCATR